jgi:hypothetical protein
MLSKVYDCRTLICLSAAQYRIHSTEAVTNLARLPSSDGWALGSGRDQWHSTFPMTYWSDFIRILASIWSRNHDQLNWGACVLFGGTLGSPLDKGLLAPLIMLLPQCLCAFG